MDNDVSSIEREPFVCDGITLQQTLILHCIFCTSIIEDLQYLQDIKFHFFPDISLAKFAFNAEVNI